MELKKRRPNGGYAKRSGQGFEMTVANGLTFKARRYLGLSLAGRFFCRALPHTRTSPYHESYVQVMRQYRENHVVSL
eukprot:scaffold163412_cov16-Prasinocladus_malaysianus.AAC.1